VYINTDCTERKTTAVWRPTSPNAKSETGTPRFPEFEKMATSTSALSRGSRSPVARPTTSATAHIATVNATTPATSRSRVSAPSSVTARLWKTSAGART
jgi:hypothetical protein